MSGATCAVSLRHKHHINANASFSTRSRRTDQAALMKSLLTLTNHVAPRWIAAVGAVMLLAVTAAEAKPRRVVHVYADQVIVHRARAVTVLDDGATVHRAPMVRDRIIDIPASRRPTRAAMLACQMG